MTTYARQQGPVLRRLVESAQFRSHAYLRALRDAQLRGSMGRVGACAANAAMESFSSLLQKNVLNRQRWTSREQLRLAIVIGIEKT
jgi:putative transposase